MCRHKVAGTRRAGSPWRSPRGGLTVTGGWSCGRRTLGGVLVKTVCGSWWCVGETTISLPALVGGTTQPASSSRAHRICTMHPVAGLAQVPLFPAPSTTHPGAALGRLGVRVTNQTSRCWVRCSSAVRELPRGQGAWHPGRHRDQCRLLW